MKKALVTLALATLSSVAFADKQAVTVVLTSSSNMTQGMAMVLANQMQAQGGQVDILLCDKAGDLALKTPAAKRSSPERHARATARCRHQEGRHRVGLRDSICPTPATRRMR
jgi:hypothetical protein